MTNQHKPESDYPPQGEQTDLQQGMLKDFDKLDKDDKKAKKSKYTDDVNDPAYVEPRLREGWTPDQPG